MPKFFLFSLSHYSHPVTPLQNAPLPRNFHRYTYARSSPSVSKEALPVKYLPRNTYRPPSRFHQSCKHTHITWSLFSSNLITHHHFSIAAEFNSKFSPIISSNDNYTLQMDRRHINMSWADAIEIEISIYLYLPLSRCYRINVQIHIRRFLAIVPSSFELINY
jgi:hypothetical protein